MDSLVKDIIMRLVGIIFSGLDFSSYYIPLNSQDTSLPLTEAQEAGAIFTYGKIVNILLNFLILAFMHLPDGPPDQQGKRAEEPVLEEPAPTPEDVVLLREIRDALKKQ